MILFAEQQRRHKEKRLLDTVGEVKGGMMWKSSIETYTLTYVKQIARGNWLYDSGNPKPVLCDDIEGWEGKGGSRGREHIYNIYTHLWMIHIDKWQKPSQYCNYSPIKNKI